MVSRVALLKTTVWVESMKLIFLKPIFRQLYYSFGGDNHLWTGWISISEMHLGQICFLHIFLPETLLVIGFN